MSIVTRFAPSPTGFLHIGGARTALFNWLYSRHMGGKFLLRIEDTDRARSTPEATQAILDGLKWLELDWDGDVVHQFARAPRHAEVAHQLLAEGKAYKCFATPEELEQMRADQKAAGQPTRYDGRWRDRDPAEAPAGAPHVIRLRAPQEGTTTVTDLVQGEVTVQNSQLDDMVLLRADGTPTYMLSVVVDDHDMSITHVIRGDDHLTNTFRQVQLYRACGWDTPVFSHIPLIHGPDGAKLSKRHGALGVEAYQEMGYLPAAMRNYLVRLGWGHGDAEVFSTEQAVEWFDIRNVGRAPSRFDFSKLASVNQHYIKESPDDALAAAVRPLVEAKLTRALSGTEAALLQKAMPALKPRAKTLVEIADGVLFYFRQRPLSPDEKALAMIAKGGAHLSQMQTRLNSVTSWTAHELEAAARAQAEETGAKLGDIAQPLRAALTGSTVSPPIFEVMELLGRDEVCGRIGDLSGPQDPATA
jgi:glutamyl-tRNA synthetase